MRLLRDTTIKKNVVMLKQIMVERKLLTEIEFIGHIIRQNTSIIEGKVNQQAHQYRDQMIRLEYSGGRQV